MIPVNEPLLGERELEYVTECVRTGWGSPRRDDSSKNLSSDGQATVAGRMGSPFLLKLLSSSDERQRLVVGAQQTIQRFRRSTMIEVTEGALRASAS